jgi:hypothetical protein
VSGGIVEQQSFLSYQLERFRSRLLVMRSAIVMGTFWTLALLGGVWLDVLGLSILKWSFWALWAYMAYPAFMVAYAIFADIAN